MTVHDSLSNKDQGEPGLGGLGREQDEQVALRFLVQ